jgi:hypothetical protein
VVRSVHVYLGFWKVDWIVSAFTAA